MWRGRASCRGGELASAEGEDGRKKDRGAADPAALLANGEDLPRVPRAEPPGAVERAAKRDVVDALVEQGSDVKAAGDLAGGLERTRGRGRSRRRRRNLLRPCIPSHGTRLP